MSDIRNQPVAVPTVVWGVVVLVIAVGAYVFATLDIGEFTTAAIVWGVIGIGVLLIVAGVIGAIARAVRPGRASTDRLTDL
jgi:hypothetical protein